MGKGGGCVASLALALLTGISASEGMAQEGPVNLQYYPPGMSRAEVVQEMRQFSFALGVRCQYCHVGGDGVSFQGVRFESDEDPDKRKARHMLRMVDALNETLLPMMADRDEPVTPITCKTCHRGLPKPALLTDVLAVALTDEGPEAMVARYQELRETRGLAGTYDFGEWEVNTLAERLQAEGRGSDAIAVYELNLEYYPESISILLSLGALYEEAGDTRTAAARYRRVLEIAPDNARATARLEAIGGR